VKGLQYEGQSLSDDRRHVGLPNHDDENVSRHSAHDKGNY
jgi:hypothetical protein